MWKRVWKGPSRQTGRHPGCVLRLSLPRRNVNMREVTVERPVRVGKSGLSLVGPSDCRDQSSVVRQLQSCFKPPKLPKKASISLSSFIGAQGHPEVWVNGRVSPGSVRGRRRAAGGSHAQEAEKLQPPVPDSVVDPRLPRWSWRRLIGRCRPALARSLPKPRICNTDRCAQAQLKQLCLTALPGRCASGVLHDR